MLAGQARTLEIVDLKKKLEEYQDRVVQSERKCKEAIEEREAATLISSSLQGVQERHIAANKALAHLSHEHETLKQKLAQKDYEISELERVQAALKDEKDQLNASMENEIQRAGQITNERDDLAVYLKMLEAKLLAIEAVNAELRQEVFQAQDTILGKDRTIQQVTARLEHAQNQIHAQGIELLDKQDIIIELERSQRSLQRISDSQVRSFMHFARCDPSRCHARLLKAIEASKDITLCRQLKPCHTRLHFEYICWCGCTTYRVIFSVTAVWYTWHTC